MRRPRSWRSCVVRGLASLFAAAVVPQVHAQDVPLSAPIAPVIAELRVHGNHTTPDAAVLDIASLAIGEPADQAAIAAAHRRLQASGRFQAVELRVRHRSLDPAAPVSVVIVVSEHAAIAVNDAGDVVMPGPLARLRRRTMFLPILGFEDGYGLTYGVRFTVVGTRQSATRLSVPLSWGGTREAALEASHTFAKGPVSRVSGRAGISRREHPFFRQGETRQDVSGEVLKRFGPGFGVGVTAARTDVRFGEVRGRLDHVGLFGELDTRTDPIYPRNAVHVRSTIARLGLRPAPGVRRITHDVRGYIGLPRAAVLALRAQTVQTSGPVPAYAQAMVGGASSLRGWRTGSAIGDEMVAGSVELRVPITPASQFARTGVAVFYDAGIAYDHGERWRDRRFSRGVGVGFFVAAPLFGLRIDVARGIDGATRLHLSVGR